MFLLTGVTRLRHSTYVTFDSRLQMKRLKMSAGYFMGASEILGTATKRNQACGNRFLMLARTTNTAKTDIAADVRAELQSHRMVQLFFPVLLFVSCFTLL
jgi:hypothetical protein